MKFVLGLLLVAFVLMPHVALGDCTDDDDDDCGEYDDSDETKSPAVVMMKQHVRVQYSESDSIEKLRGLLRPANAPELTRAQRRWLREHVHAIGNQDVRNQQIVGGWHDEGRRLFVAVYELKNSLTGVAGVVKYKCVKNRIKFDGLLGFVWWLEKPTWKNELGCK